MTDPGGGLATTDRPEPKPAAAGSGRRGTGPVGRVGLHYRQVVAELRKVIWPTRRELITYTIVAVVFVTVMVTIVSLLDIAFAKIVLQVFG